MCDGVGSKYTQNYDLKSTTYYTFKNVFSDRTTTYSSDGSKFETFPDLFSEGSTTQKNKKFIIPYNIT